MKDYLGQFGAVEVADTSNFQRVIGKRLTASWNTIPHVTHNDDFDVTALEAFRASFGPDRKISPLIFLIKALVVALQQFPQFNSSLSEDGKELIRKRYFNISIAVDGPPGLLVPVLRDADRKTVDELAAELSATSKQAREKGLPMAAMEGGSMTISSLGGIGGTSFTPIINPPEVAILGVTPMRNVAHWTGKEFEPRQMMPLSLSYDHRVINGDDAARFLRFIAQVVDNPANL